MSCSKWVELTAYESAGLKKVLQGAWESKGCTDAQVNDDGIVNFYFAKEYQLMLILEGAPYEYRGWMVAIDRWSNRNSHNFLQKIPFWIKIERLPEVYRREHIVRSIGSKMGQVDEVRIVEPNLRLDKPAEVWIRVSMSIGSEISLVQNVQFMETGEPMELEFKYKKLQKFCTTCGSLRHNYDVCPKASTLSATAGALTEIGNTPFTTAQER